MSQSSNDVIPTAICISALIDMNRLLLPNLDYLIKTIDLKMKRVKGNIKTGRTHLMDAMPIDFAQELSGWKAQLEANKKTIVLATNRMNELPQGGTAIGTGINTHKDFSRMVRPAWQLRLRALMPWQRGVHDAASSLLPGQWIPL